MKSFLNSMWLWFHDFFEKSWSLWGCSIKFSFSEKATKICAFSEKLNFKYMYQVNIFVVTYDNNNIILPHLWISNFAIFYYVQRGWLKSTLTIFLSRRTTLLKNVATWIKFIRTLRIQVKLVTPSNEHTQDYLAIRDRFFRN